MMNNSLATRGGGAISRPAQQPIRSRMHGEEQEDTLLPRLHIIQGLPQERELYGKFDEGDLINTITKERIATAAALPKFVPIFAWVEYICFKEPRGSGIEYRTRDKADVPVQDLEWRDMPGGERKGPRATRIINWVVLLDGQAEPFVLSFKTTCINTGKTINTMEKGRTAKNAGPGYYALVYRKKSNAKGPWLSPEVRPAGDPPADMKDLAEALYNSLDPQAVSTEVEQVDDENEAGGDVPPI